MHTIRVAQFGVGPIGVECVRLLAQKPWARVVGAVDIDPEKVGKSLAQLTGVASLGDAQVFADFDQLHRHARPQVVLHTAGSHAERSIAQIEPMAAQGVSVVSSCEEMLFPRLRAAEAAARLDAVCKASGARVVGAGVNPGFVMDLLPICLTGVCRSVRCLFARRVVNASRRRQPLQQKIGSGLEPDTFRRLFREGKAGHAGFRESASLLAHALGWTLDAIDETCEPVVAQRTITTEFFTVPAGMTCGLHQRCAGKAGGEVRIELDLQMVLDAADEHDAIRIEGDPPLDVVIRNGVWGDGATVGALVNVIPKLLEAPPGVRLITELAPASCR